MELLREACASKAETCTRTYDSLASVMPYTNWEWEKLSILLNPRRSAQALRPRGAHYGATPSLPQ